MEEVEISGGSMSRMRNGHGSKCMCGKGRKIILGPSNRKLLEKGGMRILRLSPEEIAENKERMTDLMEGARGSRKMNNVVTAGTRNILKPKKVEGSGKVLHDWKDLFGGTIKRDAIDEIEDGDKRKAIDLVEMLRRPEQAVRGGSMKTRINRALKSVVDTADKELSEMGRGSKKAAGFTKKKFKDVLHGVISGMGVTDMEEAMSEMEGGKFSLKRENWGIGRTGRDLSSAWSKIMSGGVLTRRQKAAQQKEAAENAAARAAAADKAAGTASVTLAPAAPRKAAPQSKAREPVASRTRSGAARRKQQPARQQPARQQEAPIDFGEDDDEIEQAVRAGNRIKDPLAWSTTKVPNKCGSAEQRAEARRAAKTLQRCPANEERRNVRSDKIKEWEARIREDERDKLEGRGLYAGFPHGSGFIQPTGGTIYGGSIGARIARPTNVGAGGNLLSPFAASKRPQAAFANFHMMQQMPVVYQPPGMFSSK